MARDGVTDNIDAMTKEEFWAAFRPLAAGILDGEQRVKPMSSRQIARELATSFTSTARWVRGTSAPTAIARQPTVDKLRAVVERLAREADELAALDAVVESPAAEGG